VAGGYERDPAPWGLDGIAGDFNNRLLTPNWDRFAPLFEAATARVPELGEAEIVQLVNGPEAFTPDGEFVLGPTQVRGLWVAAGFCAHGIAGAGGMGHLMAEWITGGQPGLDAWEMDSRRFGPQYNNRHHRHRRQRAKHPQRLRWARDRSQAGRVTGLVDPDELNWAQPALVSA
jgi:4-methylaminobutanoate oxidase (formaldehyde-forming)